MEASYVSSLLLHTEKAEVIPGDSRAEVSLSWRMLPRSPQSVLSVVLLAKPGGPSIKAVLCLALEGGQCLGHRSGGDVLGFR